MSYILERIREKKKQKQKDLNYYEIEYLKLNESRNQLIMELRDLEISSIEFETQLELLNSEMDLLEDTLLDLVNYLTKSCEELSALVSELKPSKSAKKKQKSAKKKKRPNSKVQEESLESDIENIKRMVDFLMSQYKKAIENKKKETIKGN